MGNNLVADWNRKCGKTPPPMTYPKRRRVLLDQIERVQEELKEVRDAVMANDENNLLKELSDLRVVVQGLDFLTNLPVDEAFTLVCEDNDLKFKTDRSVINRIFTQMDYHSDTHSIVKATFENVEYYSIHRTGDDKICKLQKHKELDFTPLIKGGQ